MTTLTAFQNTTCEAIWNQLEDANEGRGSLVAAIQDRLGILGDFFARYFAQDDDVAVVRYCLTRVAEELGQNMENLQAEMQEVNQFDGIDAEVRDLGGDDDDANAVQNMIAEQHWVALTAELRYLAGANDDNQLINNLAKAMDAATGRLAGALYA